MAVKVVDASASGALLFGEPDGAAVAGRLRAATLIAPALLPFEVANICIKKMRRHPEQRDALMVAFGMLDEMKVGIVEVDQGEALILAERSGLTAYGASYLWLARWTRVRTGHARSAAGGGRANGFVRAAPSLSSSGRRRRERCNRMAGTYSAPVALAARRR
jgi:predicted nucleic acid-binding protein